MNEPSLPETPTVCLFDVDGTLVTTDGAGRRAFQAALDELYGDGERMLNFDFAGMTDPGVAQRCLERGDVEPTPEAAEAIFERYLELLPTAIAESRGYTVHPGIHALLEQLHRIESERFALGLGTGNLERGARLKLDPADLNPYFAFGGFGSDAHDRGELIRAGAHRGAERLERDPERCRIVVVGDTPLDVEAARDVGAEAITVATGGATTDELITSDPDHHFATLAEDEVRSAILGHADDRS